MLALLLTVQMTGYLPPPPPRNPITDPMFAASPVRELRRQWDDCVHSIGTIVFMNGITQGDRAAEMVDLCVEYEDVLTGALVKKYGLKQATAAMAKARRTAEANLRKAAAEADAFLKANTRAAAKIDPASVPTITQVPGGCAGKTATGSGDNVRSIGYVYAANRNAEPTHLVTFSFKAPQFTRTLSARPRPLQFEIVTSRRDEPAKRYPDLIGQVYREGDDLVLVTEYKGLMVDLMDQWRPDRMTIKGPWGTSPEINLEHASKLRFAVDTCRVRGALQPGG